MPSYVSVILRVWRLGAACLHDATSHNTITPQFSLYTIKHKGTNNDYAVFLDNFKGIVYNQIMFISLLPIALENNWHGNIEKPSVGFRKRCKQ